MPSMTVWKCSSGSANSRTTRHERLRDRMLRRAVERAGDLLPPPRELGLRDVRVVHFVDHVVDLAAERVQRGDRAPPRRRQEQEAVVEARAARRGLLLAVLVRGHEQHRVRYAHRAPVARAQHRPLREHVAARRVDAREDAQAARDHRRQLEPEPPRQAPRRAAARTAAARACAPSRTSMSARQRSSARAFARCARACTPKRSRSSCGR